MVVLAGNAAACSHQDKAGMLGGEDEHDAVAVGADAVPAQVLFLREQRDVLVFFAAIQRVRDCHDDASFHHLHLDHSGQEVDH